MCQIKNICQFKFCNKFAVKKQQTSGLECRFSIKPVPLLWFQYQIIFNKEVSVCLKHAESHKQLVKTKDKNIKHLNQMTRLVSTNLAPHKRLSVNALMTIAVHNRDIILNLIEDGISRIDDFEWTRYAM